MIINPESHEGFKGIGQSLYETFIKPLGLQLGKGEPNQELTAYEGNSNDWMRQPSGDLGQDFSPKPGSSRQDR